ncbi:uncharacterized protein LOC136024943 [Artemia franciscana]|uniref:Uncharacterized protein n=1 Tax=Artemia franciscana TaxID=6661 RepID=A0AA88KZ19_ARTSF|nr:hypothetical protein QYM36_011552 [Artemia franciscana]
MYRPVFFIVLAPICIGVSFNEFWNFLAVTEISEGKGMTYMNVIELFFLGLLCTLHAIGSAEINPSQDCHLIFIKTCSKTFKATRCQLVIAMGFTNRLLTLWKAFFFAKQIWNQEFSLTYITPLLLDIVVPSIVKWIGGETRSKNFSKVVVTLEWCLFFILAWLLEWFIKCVVFNDSKEFWITWKDRASVFFSWIGDWATMVFQGCLLWCRMRRTC